MKKKELSRLLADLEIQNDFRKRVLTALVETVKPPYPCVYHFAMYALRHGFGAEEEESFEQFWIRVFRQSEKAPVTRENFLEMFEECMPAKLKGQIEPIFQAHRKDGFFPRYSDLVLGADPNPPPEPEDEDDSDVSQKDAKGHEKESTQTTD